MAKIPQCALHVTTWRTVLFYTANFFQAESDVNFESVEYEILQYEIFCQELAVYLHFAKVKLRQNIDIMAQ